MKFTLATCVRNEGPYLLEWVAHYKLLGFERIVIFSNDNDDGSDEILAEMQKEQLIEWRPRTVAPGDSPQRTAFKALSDELFGDKNEHGGYLAWFDCDEFLVLKRHSTVQALLKDFSYPDALFINWKHFGSFAKKQYERDLTVSRFLGCDSSSFHNRHGKSISKIAPDLFSMIAHHRPVPRSQDVWGRVIYATNQENDVSVAKKIVYGAHAKKHDDSPIIHEVCQLNHYAVRSKEEYVWKSIRGNGMLALDDEKIHFQKTYFNAHNLNKETETIAADQYAGPIKEYLASLPTTLSELEARVVDTLVEGYRKSLQ